MCIFVKAKLRFTYCLIILSVALANTVQASNETLISIKIDSTITLDGVIENAWDKATALTVMLENLPYKANN